jgi:hypothetical protein
VPRTIPKISSQSSRLLSRKLERWQNGCASARAPCAPVVPSSSAISMFAASPVVELPHRRCVLVPVDKQQARGAGEIAERGDGAEENGAVATVQNREAPALQHGSHPRVDGFHHREQRPLVEKAGARPSGGLRLGHDDVRGDPRAGQRRGQPGLPQPRRRRCLAKRATGVVEANADQLQTVSGKRHSEFSPWLTVSAAGAGVVGEAIKRSGHDSAARRQT